MVKISAIIFLEKGACRLKSLGYYAKITFSYLLSDIGAVDQLPTAPTSSLSS